MPILRFFLGLMVKKNNPQPLPSKHVFIELLTKKKLIQIFLVYTGFHKVS